MSFAILTASSGRHSFGQRIVVATVRRTHMRKRRVSNSVALLSWGVHLSGGLRGNLQWRWLRNSSCWLDRLIGSSACHWSLVCVWLTMVWSRRLYKPRVCAAIFLRESPAIGLISQPTSIAPIVLQDFSSAICSVSRRDYPLTG